VVLLGEAKYLSYIYRVNKIKNMGKIIKITLQIVLFYYIFAHIKIDSFYSFAEWFMGLILALFLFTKIFR